MNVELTDDFEERLVQRMIRLVRPEQAVSWDEQRLAKIMMDNYVSTVKVVIEEMKKMISEEKE